MADPIATTTVEPPPSGPPARSPQAGESPSDTQIGQSLDAWIEVPKEKLDELNAYLQDMIYRSVEAKQATDDMLVKWERQYEAQPDSVTKDWPWTNASNLIVPVTATHVEQVLSRLMGSVFIGNKLWQGMPKSSKWVNLVEPMEQWLNYVGHDVMDVYEACERWFIGMLKFGTGVAKLPWERIIRHVKYKLPDGTIHEEMIRKYDAPRLYVVPLTDFYVTPDAYTTLDIQTCDGVMQRCVFSKKGLEDKENSRVFKGIEKILNSPRATGTTMEDQKDRSMSISRTHRDNEFETWECWFSYPLEAPPTLGSPLPNVRGALSELLVDYHYDTRTILRAIYNPYRHQERPFHFIRFLPREGSLFGIGLCQMDQDFQTELSAEHNLRIDNASMSNTVAFKVKKNSGIDQIDIYPGAFIPFDDPEDIMPFPIGQVHDTLLREELHTSQMADTRAGVSEYNVGRESSAIGSRATATSTLALIREGNKRFLLTINDIRKALKNIAHQIIMLYQQFAPNNQLMYEIFSDSERKWVKDYFDMPPEYTRANVAIDVPALSEVENKDAKKQGYLTLMQVMGTFYEKIFQAVALAVNPGTPPALKTLAEDAAKGANEMWKRVLEAFDFRDPETFAPRIEEILMMEAMMEQMGGGNGSQVTGGSAGAPPNTGGPQVERPMGPPPTGAGGQGQPGVGGALERGGVTRRSAGVLPFSQG